MKIPFILLLFLVGLNPAARLQAAGTGDLYMLGVGLDQQAGVAGGWTGVGPAGAWKTTTSGAILNDHLYTTEASGALYVTDPLTGNWKQIGAAEFGNTAFMFAANNALYTIETDGSLYHVNPNDGSWTGVGPAGAWKSTVAGAVLNNQIFTIEASGALYVTDLNTGEWKQVGGAAFGNTAFMLAANDALYVLNTAGSLYHLDPSNSRWTQVGPAGGWQRAIARVGFHNQLITAESDGRLYVTNLSTGARQRIGGADFGNTTFMFAASDALYTIETSGSLYRVYLKPGGGIDAYDWCPAEIEKVFREQGRAFYRQFNSRQIIGAEATRPGILQGLAWLQQNATRNDQVVIYIGCHGGTNPDQGWGIQTADGKMLWGRQIKTELARLPCQVIIMVETCTSGGFAMPHKNDPPVPPNVTALCACTANQTTDNQLDIAVAEALYGRADFNKDGTVDLDEVIRYLRARYREWWPNPTGKDGSQTPVIVKSPAISGALPLTTVSPALAAVDYQDKLWSALLEGQRGNQYQVHLLGWSSQPGQPYFLTNQLSRDFICLPGDGAPLLVEQGGQWRPARLLSQEGAQYKIHYLGKNQDETVPRERIQFPFAGQPARG